MTVITKVLYNTVLQLLPQIQNRSRGIGTNSNFRYEHIMRGKKTTRKT